MLIDEYFLQDRETIKEYIIALWNLEKLCDDAYDHVTNNIRTVAHMHYALNIQLVSIR